MVNDSISDLLARIRNGQERKKKVIEVPFNNLVESVLLIMAKEKFVENFEVKTDAVTERAKILVYLRYVNGEGVIDTITKVSKPGSRKYSGYRELKKVKGGIGIQIVSTPAGIMTSREAKSKKVGGEILCEIW